MHFKLCSSFENQKYCLCTIRQLTPQGANLGSPQWVWPETLALKSGDVYPVRPRQSVSGFKSAPFCLHLLPTDLSNPATLQGDSHLRVSRQNENSASTRQVKGSEFSGYLATPLEACPAPTTPLWSREQVLDTTQVQMFLTAERVQDSAFSIRNLIWSSLQPCVVGDTIRPISQMKKLRFKEALCFAQDYTAKRQKNWDWNASPPDSKSHCIMLLLRTCSWPDPGLGLGDLKRIKMRSYLFCLLILFITMTKASGGDGIPVELFQILKRWCCESAALNMLANLENSAVARGLKKVSFYSNPKEGQCWRIFKLLYRCTHLTR